MSEAVHYVAWGQQPDIQVFCDEAWTQPGWGQTRDEDGPWRTDETPPRLYTFEKGEVTCSACLNKIALACPRREAGERG